MLIFFRIVVNRRVRLRRPLSLPRMQIERMYVFDPLARTNDHHIANDQWVIAEQARAVFAHACLAASGRVSLMNDTPNGQRHRPDRPQGNVYTARGRFCASRRPAERHPTGRRLSRLPRAAVFQQIRQQINVLAAPSADFAFGISV
jgi:hypothetical protein